MTTWHEETNQVIAALCRESYLQANRLKNGQMRKRHVPYSVPESALSLIDALNCDDEERAKAILMYDYHVEQVRWK